MSRTYSSLYRITENKDGSCVVKLRAGPGRENRHYVGRYPSRAEAEAEVRRLEQGEEL